MFTNNKQKRIEELERKLKRAHEAKRELSRLVGSPGWDEIVGFDSNGPVRSKIHKVYSWDRIVSEVSEITSVDFGEPITAREVVKEAEECECDYPHGREDGKCDLCGSPLREQTPEKIELIEKRMEEADGEMKKLLLEMWFDIRRNQ